MGNKPGKLCLNQIPEYLAKEFEIYRSLEELLFQCFHCLGMLQINAVNVYLFEYLKIKNGLS